MAFQVLRAYGKRVKLVLLSSLFSPLLLMCLLALVVAFMA